MPEKLDRLSEELTRASTVFPKALRALRDAMDGQPSAQCFDEAHMAGYSSRKFCDSCGNDPTGCRCETPHIVTVPAVVDITGEVATSFDPARNTHRRVAHLIRELERSTRELVGHIADWNPKPAPTLDRGEKLDLEGSNRPKCDWHLRYGHDRDSVRQATKVKHQGRELLTEAHRLCDWCITQVERLGRLPTQAEVNNHAAGKQLRVPVEDTRPGWQRRLSPPDTATG